MPAKYPKNCSGCNIPKDENGFRLVKHRLSGKPYRLSICIPCESVFFSRNKNKPGDRTKEYRGPIEREYSENGMRVLVLPRSAGFIQ